MSTSVPLLDSEQAERLPARAREVVEYRKQNGPFRSREQLMQVPGVGPARYVQAYEGLGLQPARDMLAYFLDASIGASVHARMGSAAEWVRRTAAPGDRVLVKASHGVRLDELVKELTAA